MNPKMLSELEMFELLQAAYPDRFIGDDDDTFEAAMEFAEDFAGWEDVADLLSRVVMLTMPIKSGLSNRLNHCLGPVTIANGKATMIAAIRRDV